MHPDKQGSRVIICTGTRRLVELITIGAVSVGSSLKAVHIRGGGKSTVDIFYTH